MRQRINIEELSEAQLHSYLTVFGRLKTQRVYRDLQEIHTTEKCQHDNRLFLPWHRAYSLRFEDALWAESGAQFGLPYWNWLDHADDTQPPRLFSEDRISIGGQERDNPLYHRRDLGEPRRPRSLPKNPGFSQALDQAASWRLFGGQTPPSEGRGKMEGFHNEIHQWASLDMRDPDSSPRDPIFWHLHSFVDLVWSTRQPQMEPRGRELQEQLPGFTDPRGNPLLVGDVLHISNLGYEYVVKSVDAPVVSEGAVVRAVGGDKPKADYGLVEIRFEQLQLPQQLQRLRLHFGTDASLLSNETSTRMLEIPLFGLHTASTGGHNHVNAPGASKSVFLLREELRALGGENAESLAFMLEAKSENNGNLHVGKAKVIYHLPKDL